MAEVYEHIKAQGVTHIVFGDLFLGDIRAWREAKLAAAGMEGLFPLWKRDTGRLALQMISAGWQAIPMLEQFTASSASRRHVRH